MKKLNSKYVESVVKKAVDGKIVAVHREKTLEHGPNWEKAGDEGQKKKDWKTNMEAGAKSTVEKVWLFQTRNTTETNNVIAEGEYHLISPSK